MQRLENCFSRLRQAGRKALITFITAGDPILDATPELVDCLVAGGADIVELGVPFSDPLADGPTIEAASGRALAQGATLAGILSTVKGIRRRQPQLPLVLMTYYNPIFHYGLERLVAEAVAVGVDGLIVPDLPLEESGELRRLAVGRLAVIPLAAPTTSAERLAEIVASGSGFLYYVTITGITGARSGLPPELAENLDLVRSVAKNLPVAAGFGISTPEQVRSVGSHADAVIVGSALVEIIGRGQASDAGRRELTARVKSLREALD
ncbi:MAG TPA: tryptophan synthase subunit alpha [Proteobacteria bacterium]|nr:tryptophan synthase subunit alpha [Pseudomonadota bacterium]